jgi:hypothetical protein
VGNFSALPVSLGLFALCAAPEAQATSGAAFGIGPRALALAGAGATMNTGYEASLTNPAELAQLSAPDLELGYGATRFSLSLTPERLTAPTDGAGSTLLGFALPLRFGEQALVFGLAAQSPSNRIATASLPYPEQPQFPLLVQRSQATDFDLSVGMRPLSFLSLGAGLRGLASLSGTVTVVKNPDGTSSSAVADTLKPVLAPLFGATAALGRHDALSLVFRGALRSDFSVDVAAVNLGATTLPELHIAGVADYDPLTLYGEFQHDFGAISLLAGVAYQRWSDFPGLLGQTVRCPPERPNCTALPAPQFVLQDTWAPHLAAVWDLGLSPSANATLRAGYSYEPSPAPNQTAESNVFDNARHVFGLGYGVALARPLVPLHSDFACQVQELVSRTHHKGPGVSSDNPGFPQITTGGFVESCALTIGVKLR